MKTRAFENISSEPIYLTDCYDIRLYIFISSKSIKFNLVLIIYLCDKNIKQTNILNRMEAMTF